MTRKRRELIFFQFLKYSFRVYENVFKRKYIIIFKFVISLYILFDKFIERQWKVGQTIEG